MNEAARREPGGCRWIAERFLHSAQSASGALRIGRTSGTTARSAYGLGSSILKFSNRIATRTSGCYLRLPISDWRSAVSPGGRAGAMSTSRPGAGDWAVAATGGHPVAGAGAAAIGWPVTGAEASAVAAAGTGAVAGAGARPGAMAVTRRGPGAAQGAGAAPGAGGAAVPLAGAGTRTGHGAWSEGRCSDRSGCCCRPCCGGCCRCRSKGRLRGKHSPNHPEDGCREKRWSDKRRAIRGLDNPGLRAASPRRARVSSWRASQQRHTTHRLEAARNHHFPVESSAHGPPRGLYLAIRREIHQVVQLPILQATQPMKQRWVRLLKRLLKRPAIQRRIRPRIQVEVKVEIQEQTHVPTQHAIQSSIRPDIRRDILRETQGTFRRASRWAFTEVFDCRLAIPDWRRGHCGLQVRALSAYVATMQAAVSRIRSP